ncbi:MAG: hypothetical protein AAF399_06700 [Bacteroidota bacterium]
MMNRFLLSFLLAFGCLSVPKEGRAQADLQYFAFETILDLPDEQHIYLNPGGTRPIALGSGYEIRLIPPDMALIDQARIQQTKADTIAQSGGPALIRTTCWVDSLFLTSDLFLLDFPMVIEYYEDGTFEGVSTFGWELFQRLGECVGPQMEAGQAILRIRNLPADHLSETARFRHLLTVDPILATSLPFQTGDLGEIRLIGCNRRPQTQEKISSLATLLGNQALYCQSHSVDPQVPPIPAVSRLQQPVTVRFFEDQHQERAQALAEAIAYLFDMEQQEVLVEDMQAAYNGRVPIQDYLEVWVR